MLKRFAAIIVSLSMAIVVAGHALGVQIALTASSAADASRVRAVSLAHRQVSEFQLVLSKKAACCRTAEKSHGDMTLGHTGYPCTFDLGCFGTQVPQTEYAATQRIHVFVDSTSQGMQPSTLTKPPRLLS